jgi:hypothetical protein
VLDALGGVEEGVHEDEEMIAPVVTFLVLQKEIHERFFESKHGDLF